MSLNVIDESHQSDIHLISLWSNRCSRPLKSFFFLQSDENSQIDRIELCWRVFQSLSLKFTRMCLVTNYSFYLIPHSVSKMVGKCHDSSQWPCLVQYTMSVFNTICVDVDRVICCIHEGILSVFKALYTNENTGRNGWLSWFGSSLLFRAIFFSSSLISTLLLFVPWETQCWFFYNYWL